MSQMTIRGATIEYDDQGQGDALVLIHGSPFNRSMWDPQTAILQSSYRVVTFDLRGYGRSTAPVSEKTFLSDFAHDTADLMDTLNIPAAGVMGLSKGGQIALEFYRLYPQRVTALILADTFAQLDTPENKQNRYWTADRLMREGMQGYAQDNLSKMNCSQTIATQPAVVQHVMEMMLTTPPAGAAAALRGRAERQDYTEILSQIAAPTLIVVGDQDAFTPVSDAKYMHERIPQSELVVIEQAGHMPNLEQPEAFNQALRGFLEKTIRIG